MLLEVTEPLPAVLPRFAYNLYVTLFVVLGESWYEIDDILFIYLVLLTLSLWNETS